MEEDNNFESLSELSKRERRALKRQEGGSVSSNKKSPSRVIFILVLVFVALALVFLFAKKGEAPVGSLLDKEVALLDHVKGNKNASTTLIEYSDFECPACALYYPAVKDLEKEFGDKLAIVYRHFPLSQHKNANLAAIASEAAGLQGKFWQMHDVLFERQAEWAGKKEAPVLFASYAKEIGLDLAQFEKDIASTTLSGIVSDNQTSGIKAGVKSTPSFYLNGELLLIKNDTELKNTVAEALAGE